MPETLILLVIVLAFVGLLWARFEVRRSAKKKQGQRFSLMEVSFTRIVASLLVAIIVGSIWWVAFGHRWMEKQLDLMVQDVIAFPVPDTPPNLEATVSLDNRSVRICNASQTIWKTGMVQVNDSYVATIGKTKPGKCEEIGFSEFTTKDWKRLAAGSPPVYKVQIYISEPSIRYGQYPVLSSRIEQVAQSTRKECIPEAVNRPFVDWKGVPLPTSSGFLTPEIKFIITEGGLVDEVSVSESSNSKAIDDAVITVARQWKYKPAPGCGKREAHVRIEVDYGAMGSLKK